MVKFVLVFLLFISVKESHQAHCLPGTSEITNPVLEKGKPIQLSGNSTQVQISEFNGTIYYDTLSQLSNVTELKICQSHINEIEAGALCSAPRLKSLLIEFYESRNLPILTKKTFENCDHLEELVVGDNTQIGSFKISEDALENISSLKKLTFYGYNFSRLGADVLKIPENVTSLSFSYANIHNIDPNVFATLNNLQDLEIIHNRLLSSLPKNIFKNNPKLKRLYLEDNAIQDLTWDEFEGLSNLEGLNVVNNRISSFDADKIAKNLPNLKILQIQLNEASDEQGEDFVKKLNNKMKSSVNVSYKFPTCLSYICS